MLTLYGIPGQRDTVTYQTNRGHNVWCNDWKPASFVIPGFPSHSKHGLGSWRDIFILLTKVPCNPFSATDDFPPYAENSSSSSKAWPAYRVLAMSRLRYLCIGNCRLLLAILNLHLHSQPGLILPTVLPIYINYKYPKMEPEHDKTSFSTRKFER